MDVVELPLLTFADSPSRALAAMERTQRSAVIAQDYQDGLWLMEAEAVDDAIDHHKRTLAEVENKVAVATSTDPALVERLESQASGNKARPAVESYLRDRNVEFLVIEPMEARAGRRGFLREYLLSEFQEVAGAPLFMPANLLFSRLGLFSTASLLVPLLNFIPEGSAAEPGPTGGTVPLYTVLTKHEGGAERNRRGITTCYCSADQSHPILLKRGGICDQRCSYLGCPGGVMTC